MERNDLIHNKLYICIRASLFVFEGRGEEWKAGGWKEELGKMVKWFERGFRNILNGVVD